ncbi:MAG TPA: hypothetical protein VMA31_16765, partial [Bryobacteraceae bacterium]|nr:hypothetical protein [Bryobacteraceae bacterium]
MSNRRTFLGRAIAGLAAAYTACRKPAPVTSAEQPGAPPAFGVAPEVGPPVSPTTFAEAEKLVQFPLQPAERHMAAANWRSMMAPLYVRRAGPRKFAPPPDLAPATVWNPVLPGLKAGPERDRFIRTPLTQDTIPA